VAPSSRACGAKSTALASAAGWKWPRGCIQQIRFSSLTVITTLLSTEHVVHTHTLVFFFSSGVESRHLFCLLAGIALQDDLLGASWYPSLSPIFLLAQLLMRTDLGGAPDSPRRLRSSPTGGGGAQGCRKPQVLGANPSLQPNFQGDSWEIRTADTATVCQTLKALQKPESSTRVTMGSNSFTNQHAFIELNPN